MEKFKAKIEIIGVNPYVEIPATVLLALQHSAQKERGPIPVKGLLNGKPYIQTVVKFAGLWRLYLNTPMRKDTQTDVGDTITIEIEYDPAPRTVEIPKELRDALATNTLAQENFAKLPPYRQKEISRYIGNLKSEIKRKEQVAKTVRFLCGEKIKGVLFSVSHDMRSRI